MKSLSSRTIVYGLLIVFGLLCSLPNILPYSLSKKLPAWYTDTTISMGLDLQGGSHLLLEADTKELLNKQYDLLQSELTSELKKQGIYYASPVISESGLYIPIRKIGDIDKSIELASQLARNSTDGKKRFDIKKETDGIQISLDQRWVESLVTDVVNQSLEVVRKRLDETGLVDPSITRQGKQDILVQMPGVADPTKIRELLGTTAKMTFHWAATDTTKNTVTYPDINTDSRYRLETQVAMEGKHIRDAQVGFNQKTGEPVVNFKLDSEGAKLFGNMTHNVVVY